MRARGASSANGCTSASMPTAWAHSSSARATMVGGSGGAEALGSGAVVVDRLVGHAHGVDQAPVEAAGSGTRIDDPAQRSLGRSGWVDAVAAAQAEPDHQVDGPEHDDRAVSSDLEQTRHQLPRHGPRTVGARPWRQRGAGEGGQARGRRVQAALAVQASRRSGLAVEPRGHAGQLVGQRLRHRDEPLAGCRSAANRRGLGRRRVEVERQGDRHLAPTAIDRPRPTNRPWASSAPLRPGTSTMIRPAPSSVWNRRWRRRATARASARSRTSAASSNRSAAASARIRGSSGASSRAGSVVRPRTTVATAA